MRILSLLVLALLSMVCVTRTAHAQINSCIGPHGERVFTDQPCGGSSIPANGQASPGGDGMGYLNAVCPRSPQELRDRIAGAFASDDPNVLSGLILWRGMDRSAANAQMREFRRWLKQPLVGVDFSGGVALAAQDPGQGDSQAPEPASSISGDGGTDDPQPGDADEAPLHPEGLTVLTQSRGGADDYAAPNTRSFGMDERGGCWWLTF